MQQSRGKDSVQNSCGHFQENIPGMWLISAIKLKQIYTGEVGTSDENSTVLEIISYSSGDFLNHMRTGLNWQILLFLVVSV